MIPEKTANLTAIAFGTGWMFYKTERIWKNFYTTYINVIVHGKFYINGSKGVRY